MQKVFPFPFISFCLLLLLLLLVGGFSFSKKEIQRTDLQIGASLFDEYLPLLKNKKVGLVVNQTSMVGKSHLADTLLALKVDVGKIFAPEHGFRGDADAGAHIDNSTDPKTKLPLISIYGKNKKPTAEQLADLDVLIFDIQDVGVRFYTYISTMHYIMEACAENGKTCIVLDRPNPNGDYIDGAIREKGFESFVGLHPIPIVHGLTVGELAMMINGEKWLASSNSCSLKVIKMRAYTHLTHYELPIKPSPNLPNHLAIRLYPSLCLFEGTMMSVGRGTTFPFQTVGYPDSKYGAFSFTPKALQGMDSNPLYKEQICYGIDLRNQTAPRFTLSYLLDFYQLTANHTKFINNGRWFNLLAGNSTLQEQIKNGKTEKEIKESWQDDLKKYKKMRKKYLLYPDFE